jgi:thiamine pyrophosphate-dependent acetolactate synthase large subunit-like protein
MQAYEAIAQSLISEGVTDFFGLMGDGNMWLWGALCRNSSVKAYSARHESMAVSMADGYARTTGKVGVAMVTCGPGLTQCGTSLIAAYRGRTPVLLIAGEIQPGAKNKLQWIDQRRFAEASYARFHTVTSLDNMAEEIAEAFYAVRVHRVPVVLNLPMHLQEESLSAVHSVPAAPRGEPKPGSAGAGDRKADRGGAAGHHRRQGCDGGEREGCYHRTRRSRRRIVSDLAARQGLFCRPSLGYRYCRCVRFRPVGALAC